MNLNDDLQRPRVGAAEFVRTLEQFGVTLIGLPDGEIRASPDCLVSEADRRVLRKHRAAILAAITTKA